MTDIVIRKQGRAGLITLNRPQALNALTWDMCLQLEQAIDLWRDDNDVHLIIIDGAGDRAFCSGGDIADMYASGQNKDYDYGRRFWRDEYRLNAKIAEYTKPIVTFLHGFTMGGGVGVGCHASHRIVCETSQIAMPECGIGLIPDVGGTLLLANAPGFIGTYLGLSGDRMDAGDAIYVGFADSFVPTSDWEALKNSLILTGIADIPHHASPKPRLMDWRTDIDIAFQPDSLPEIAAALGSSPIHQTAQKLISRNSPLAMACAIPLINAARTDDDIRPALTREFQFTYRAVADSDFIEGIRAAIIDRDRAPKWRHASLHAVGIADIAEMTRPLGADALQF